MLDASGRNVQTAGSFWADTVYIPSGATAVLVTRFVEWTGPYVAHCHILAHEARISEIISAFGASA